MIQRTKIVCTIGPASESKETLTLMMRAGMNVARLNFSHGNYQHHAYLIKQIREAARQCDRPMAMMQDLQGPKIRVGNAYPKGIALAKQEEVVLVPERRLYRIKPRGRKLIPIQFEPLARSVSKGDVILIDDGLIDLRVRRVSGGLITCTVANPGLVLPHKGMNIPGVSIDVPVLTQKDQEDIRFGLQQKAEYIALSFVRTRKDILQLRRLLKPIADDMTPKIIAKIENQDGVKNIDQIIAAADGIMIARGDLGIEIPAEQVPTLQKQMIEKCVIAGKPVIVATQMLDSMIRNPRPTRAEVSDVANAVVDHTDAVMLSGESAFGMYPVESVAMMSNIIRHTESTSYAHLPHQFLRASDQSMDAALANAAHELSKDIDAKAILVNTTSGYSASMMARQRPYNCPMFALTNEPYVYHQLSLVWGIIPFISSRCNTVDELINHSIAFIRRRRIVRRGDKVVIVTGQPIGKVGTMNLIKVHTI
jgi:pyruvate kinase